MRRYGLVLAACLLVLTGCRGAEPQPTPGKPAYEVYSALINQVFLSGRAPGSVNSKVRLIVIEPETIAVADRPEHLNADLDYVVKKARQRIEADTLADFRAKNQQSQPLRREFGLNAPFAFLGDRGDYDGWEGFQKKYPDAQGIMTLSRAGFNDAQDQALVYVHNASDGLAGAWVYVVLRKRGGAWEIEDQVAVRES